MNNKYINKFILYSIIVFLVMLTMIQRNKIVQLENEKKENIASEITLENCPFCDGEATIKQVNDSYYIKCEDCKLETNYFDSKYELVQYWNNRNGDNK